jgi:hypothetical protein
MMLFPTNEERTSCEKLDLFSELAHLVVPENFISFTRHMFHLLQFSYKLKNRYLLTNYSALQQVHSLFQGEFSRQYDLLNPLSSSSTFSFP